MYFRVMNLAIKQISHQRDCPQKRVMSKSPKIYHLEMNFEYFEPLNLMKSQIFLM